MGSTDSAIGGARPGTLHYGAELRTPINENGSVSVRCTPPFPCSMRLLVVVADKDQRSSIRAAASNWAFALPSDWAVSVARFTVVEEADSVAAGLRCLLHEFDILIVDTRLGDDSGLLVVEHAGRRDQPPAVLGLSDEGAECGFELAKLGARDCLAKPLELTDLREAIQKILVEPPELSTWARAQVGHRHLHVVQDEVKSAMLRRAIMLEHGNITRAARRLGVTRAAVQQMLDRYGLPRSCARRDSDPRDAASGREALTLACSTTSVGVESLR